jgi:hypothetical protein
MKKGLLVLFIFLFFISFISGDNVLKVNPTNPRYFTDDSGEAIYLTGSHTWTNLIDDSTSYPPVSFDYEGYLDFMEVRNHNFMRMWTWELFKYNYNGGSMQYSLPQPWKRTGPGNALDGRLKFDLTLFNEDYFERLRSRVIAAGERDIYVSIMLFEGHGIQRSDIPWCWDGHPFNVANNINGINGNPNSDDRGLEINTLQVPAVTSIQEAYVRKVIDTVNDLDNVLYEIVNEAGPYSTEWQYYMINYIKSYESTKLKQHPVGMTFQINGGTNTALFNSPADWISPAYFSTEDYRDNPPAANGQKIIIPDTDHLWGIGGSQSWVWKSFLRGLNPIYMDPYGDLGDPFYDSGDNSIRNSMGYTLNYASRMNLVEMISMNSLSSTTYCLANPGNEYLIYQPGTESFTVNLEAGDYDYEWFNPDTGIIVSSGTVAASGGSKSFTPPFSGDAVLYLYNSDNSPSEDNSLIPQTNWTLHYFDSEELISENGAAVNAFDGDINTHWHTKYSSSVIPQPHEIQIDLNDYYNLVSLIYLPRQDGGDNGRIKDCEFYVSSDGVNWVLALSGTFFDTAEEQEVSFTEQTNVRYVKLKTLSAYDDDPWTTIAEINLKGSLYSEEIPLDLNDTSNDSLSSSSSTSSSSSSSSTSSSTSSSSSSSGGSGASFWKYTYLISKEKFKEGYNGPLEKAERIRVEVGKKYHHVGIVELILTTATINISSNPMQVILSIGQDVSLDVNRDGIYDIYLLLNSIENNKANLTVKEINEKALEGEGAIRTQGEISDEGSDNLGEKKDYTWFYWIIVGVIVVIIILAVIWIFIQKSKSLLNSYSPYESVRGY